MAMDNERALPTSIKGGSVKVKASWVYRGNLQIPIFWLIINIFRQCFRGTYTRGCTWGSQCSRFQGCILGHLVGRKWNSHEWGLLWIGGTGLKLQNERECLELPVCVKMCVHLSECLYASYVWRVQVAEYGFIGSAMVLLILGCYFFLRAVIGGNK